MKYIARRKTAWNATEPTSEKAAAPEAVDPEKGRLLWEKSAELLRPHLR